MPIDYSKGKIYKIIDINTNECYIGSTCEPSLARRLAGHVSDYKRYLNGKGCYVTSFKIIEQGDYDIVLIENFPCNNKDELHARERYYTNNILCVNKIKQQGLYNKLGHIEYCKQYYEDNKDQMKQYREDNKDQMKQYYKDNKDQYKQYYQTNKEKIKLQRYTKHNCQCGGCYTHAHKTCHYKSTIHQQYEENRIYYFIKQGLDIIKKLDKNFQIKNNLQ